MRKLRRWIEVLYRATIPEQFTTADRDRRAAFLESIGPRPAIAATTDATEQISLF